MTSLSLFLFWWSENARSFFSTESTLEVGNFAAQSHFQTTDALGLFYSWNMIGSPPMVTGVPFGKIGEPYGRLGESPPPLSLRILLSKLHFLKLTAFSHLKIGPNTTIGCKLAVSFREGVPFPSFQRVNWTNQIGFTAALFERLKKTKHKLSSRENDKKIYCPLEMGIDWMDETKNIYICMYIYTWNPNDPCFDWRPCFGGFEAPK